MKIDIPKGLEDLIALQIICTQRGTTLNGLAILTLFAKSYSGRVDAGNAKKFLGIESQDFHSEIHHLRESGLIKSASMGRTVEVKMLSRGLSLLIDAKKFYGQDEDIVEASKFEQSYYEALQDCGDRYVKMANPNQELRSFVREFQDGVMQRMPLMKLNRWLGYIQGTLIAEGKTTVDAEREWTRPKFRPLDFPVG